MGILKRLGNNDVGSPTQVGGNDWDELYDYLNGIALSGKSADINTSSTFASGKAGFLGYTDFLKISTPANPAAGQIRLYTDSTDDKIKVKKSSGTIVDLEASAAGGATDLTGLTDVTITTPTRGDILVRDTTDFKNKAKGTANQVLTMDATGNDPVWATPSTGLEQKRRYYHIYIDVADGSYKARNGATGAVDYSSTTNLADVINSIIGGITTFPQIIEIGAGDFNLTTAINPITKSNVVIKGQGPGLTRLILTQSITGNPNIIDITGALTGSSANLTATADIHQSTATIADTTNFAVNDYVLLRSTKSWIGGQGKQGEIRQIRSKTATVLTFDGPVQDTYTTTDVSNVQKINMVENVTVEGFSMKPASSSWVQTGSFIAGMFCRNLVYRNICAYNMYGFNTNCVYIRSSIESKMDHCQGILEEGFPLTGNHPYCFKFSQANRACTMESCNMIGPWRHLVASEGSDAADCEGACRGITISNCFITGAMDSGFDTHENGEDIQFIGCTVEGGAEHGFNVRSPGVQIKNCNVVGVDDYGIYLFGNATDALIVGNSVRRAGHGIRLAGSVRVVISGNKLQDCGDSGIYIDNSTDLQITSNMINNCNLTANNAAIYDASSTGTNRITVIGNMIKNNHRAMRMVGTSTGWKIAFNTCETNNNSSTLIGTNKILGNSGDSSLVDNI